MVLAAIAVLGCGEDASRPNARLVDPGGRAAPINGLELEPASGAILLSTNRGLYRIARGSDRAERLKSRVVTPKGSSPVGKFLPIAAGGPSLLLASGHPDKRGKLPSFLGFLTSRDGGRTWKVKSRFGLADMHSIVPAHGHIYALDTVLDGLLVGDATGSTWKERVTPGSQMLDLVVDPDDADHLLASDKNGVYRSEDQGRRWKQLDRGESPRLAWPDGGVVYRADANRRVYKSKDRGTSWELASLIDGRPWRLTAAGDKLLVALGDGTVLESGDGAQSWEKRFEP